MIKRLILTLISGTGFVGMASAAPAYSLGESSFSTPAGWSQIRRDDDRLTLASSDGKQQATISLMQFKISPSFEDFKKLCSLRLEAEKKGLQGVFLQPEVPEPIKTDKQYLLIYSGGEKSTGRIFSAYLCLTDKELITIYVEAIGVEPKIHLQSFQAIVSSLKQK